MDSGDAGFYRKHADDLMCLASALVGPNDAEDVFVTAFLNVTGSSRWGRLVEDDKRGYLYRAVVNQSRSWARSRSRASRRDALWAAREIADPVITPRPEVWDAVCELSPNQRAVVFLTYWADLSSEDVANTLGMSSSSVRQHLARARKKLRRSLDD
jgi:RNA polymerase sigma factor (sigma-70 family)